MVVGTSAAPRSCARVTTKPTLRSRLLTSRWTPLARSACAALLVGFAGNWNGPVVATLVLTAGLTFFDLGRRDRAEQVEGADRVADRFGGAMQLAFLAILCAAAWDNRAPGSLRLPGLLEALGLVVILIGVRLRRDAAQALGRHFTVRLSLHDGHELVSTGPYQWIRHPNYAGLALVAFGTALMVRSPVAAAVAAGVWLPVVLLRIRDEERALSERYGVAYAEYSQRSWRLVRGIY